MKVPRLITRSINIIEGRVVFPENWWDNSPRVRAGVLSDWIYYLRLEQIEAIEAIGDKAAQRAAGYDIIEEPQPRLLEES